MKKEKKNPVNFSPRTLDRRKFNKEFRLEI